MRHIGLMMVRNEADVLLEALNAHARWFDTIVAQDGSTDEGRAFLIDRPEVVKLFRDEEVLKPGERWTDGHRQFALEWIMENFGVEDVWVTLLHADEFFQDDPIAAAEQAAKEGASHVVWGEYRFFLHTSDKERWRSARSTAPVASRSATDALRWYVGPFFEVRQFSLAHHQVYSVGKDHCTLPWGPPPHRRARAIPRYRHYPYRSPEQMRRCLREKVEERYWQPDHAWLAESDGFVDRLPPPTNSPLAKWDRVAQYDGTLPDPAQFLPKWWKG